jgi:hypothetical protein
VKLRVVIVAVAALLLSAKYSSAAESFFNRSQLTSLCRGSVSRTATITQSGAIFPPSFC